jgi:CRP-like cAMP-binding protein
MMVSDILMTTGVYSSTDIKLFESKTKTRSVSKDEILLNPGEVCKSFFFSITGAFYQFNYKDEIEENVLDLHVDHEWFLNQSSFIAQKPSDRFIKAYREGKILELDIVSLHCLIGESAAFLQLGKILQQATAQAYFFDNRLTPTQKYQYILENRGELIQKFPLKLIASYLKITPETLSRVRESLSKGKVIS